MPRKDLTLADKIALLDQIKSLPVNVSNRRLAEITGVPKSTIARVVQQEHQLREEWALCEGKAGSSQKRKREGKNPDVEKALFKWFCIITGQGMSVTGPILKDKSEEIAKMLGHNNFKATDGWLSRWKARHNIKLKTTHCPTVPDEEEDFLIIGNHIQCHYENEDSGDAIDEHTNSKKLKLDKDQRREDEDPLEKQVTHQEARQFINGLQRYFMQKGNEGSPTSALNICADFVELQSDTAKRKSILYAILHQ